MVLVMSTGLGRRQGPLKITGPRGVKRRLVVEVEEKLTRKDDASTIKGIGDASTLKMTKRTLSKFSHKKGGNGGYNGRGRR
jgi:hypothetical protein